MMNLSNMYAEKGFILSMLGLTRVFFFFLRKWHHKVNDATRMILSKKNHLQLPQISHCDSGSKVSRPSSLSELPNRNTLFICFFFFKNPHKIQLFISVLIFLMFLLREFSSQKYYKQTKSICKYFFPLNLYWMSILLLQILKLNKIQRNLGQFKFN